MTENPADSSLGDFLSGTDLGQSLDDAVADVGQRIAEARIAAAMSPTDFSEQLGVTEATVAAWEAGEQRPRSNRLLAISGMLGVSVSWLMIGRGDTPPSRAAASAVGPELAEIRSELTAITQRIDRLLASLPG